MNGVHANHGRRPGLASSALGCLIGLFLMATATSANQTWPQAQFDGLLAGLGETAERDGISRATLDRALAGLAPDLEILEFVKQQPEHTLSAGAYINALAAPDRIDAGRRKLAEHADTLRQIEAAYGVDRHTLVAIWGIESNFGVAPGGRSALRSLATLAAYHTRRQAFWRSELVAVLQLIERGDAQPEQLTGSWAGAMGHTQFMPTSILAHAVDFDSDGRRDIWGSVPDALASTANYLRAFGWTTGEPWGLEVKLPADFDYALSAPAGARPLSGWRRLQVAPAAEGVLPEAGGDFELLLPSGAEGPAFLAGRNFNAILKYNTAVTYALAVAHLGDRIAGGPGIVTTWPIADQPLDRAAREDLQRRLVARGLPTGGIDGIIGTQSRDAIRAFQKRAGLPQDGHPSLELLQRMQREDGDELHWSL